MEDDKFDRVKTHYWVQKRKCGFCCEGEEEGKFRAVNGLDSYGFIQNRNSYPT